QRRPHINAHLTINASKIYKSKVAMRGVENAAVSKIYKSKVVARGAENAAGIRIYKLQEVM
ncbi:hypothetical protein, partial [Flavihumibacter sp. ZG627]|uniref:hypothetical protein n=1 Tax=Flavihumibacter sp. ZG627 TaxID=1463156 RepID=UPI0005823CE3